MSRIVSTTIPGIRLSSLTIEQLALFQKVLADCGAAEVAFTSTGRISLSGANLLPAEQISRALAEVLPPPAEQPAWLTSLRVCPGPPGCKYGVKSGEALHTRIEQLQLENTVGAKIKVGIAGCAMCCTEPLVRDIGLVAEQKGWKLFFGGNGGSRARVGDKVAEGLTDQQALELVARCLRLYLDEAKPKMRTARFLEEFGTEKFLEIVLAEPY